METHALERRSIERLIEAKTIGNYWLGEYTDDGQYFVRYIGRSDKCLRKRLTDHVSVGKYVIFSFSVAHSIREGFDIECREYHLLKDQLDNIIHPDAPRHLPYRCQYCGIDSIIQSKQAELVGGDY